MKNQQHILIAQLPLSSDAHILRGLLQAEGITVFMFDEGFSSLAPANALTIGGIKIHVPFKQKEQAKMVVDTFYDNLKEENTAKCANCDSVNLKYDLVEHIKHIIMNLLVSITSINASHGVRKFKRCLNCGYRN